MTYESPTAGCEISCIMLGIDQSLLLDNKNLEQLFVEALEQDNFTILQSAAHEFKPHGYSSIKILSESHAGIHTYPEHGSLFFYLHSCRGPEDGLNAFEYLKNKLQPEIVDENIRVIQIGQK